MTNAVVVKEEPMEEDIEEEVATYSIEISPEEAADAQVKLEEVMFDWSDKEDNGDGENSN